MTTIVYRNGYLAADTRAYSGNKPPIGRKTKIFYNAEHQIACGTSSSQPGVGELFWSWLIGETGDAGLLKDKEFTALVIEKGQVYVFENSVHPSGPLEADFFAIGTGREYALGAMEMGASAPEAVRVACKLDVWSADPITVLDVRSEEEKETERRILDRIVHPIPRQSGSYGAI